MLEIVAGWEPREAVGYHLCAFSAIRRTTVPLRFIPLMERALRFQHLYRRPHEERDGQMWCPISDAPMATSFANSRFLAPWLASEPWALFCDFADMLFLADPAELLALADPRYAVQVVKRDHAPSETRKMDGQKQTIYHRKNWSSVVLWNVEHPANQRLTLDDVNERPGRDLHAFFWLEDDEIGELPKTWNWLVGVDPEGEADSGLKPQLLHYTSGAPFMKGHENGPWAAEWHREAQILDATRQRVEIKEPPQW